ncbi:MAG TPA: hypothetical protein VK364_13205, partial [Hymenobacter sp.]|nr:hypothetical protein [Hymenobacter sp.]
RNRLPEQPLAMAPDVMITQASVVPIRLSRSRQATQFWLALLTFVLVTITWVFFRAPDFGTATRLLLAMFGLVDGQKPLLTTLALYKVLLVTVALLGCHWLMRDTSVTNVAGRLPWWSLGLAWAAMLIVLVLTQKSTGSFIYFQF